MVSPLVQYFQGYSYIGLKQFWLSQRLLYCMLRNGASGLLQKLTHFCNNQCHSSFGSFTLQQFSCLPVCWYELASGMITLADGDAFNLAFIGIVASMLLVSLV